MLLHHSDMTNSTAILANKKETGTRSGQAMVLIVVVLVALAVIVLWLFNMHHGIHMKGRAQNGGDSAAIAAARWQGITLNLIGDLNLIRALALSTGGSNLPSELASCDELQARLCYVGPMLGLLAAQETARANRIPDNQYFADELRAHAALVRSEALTPNLANTSYENCLEEYAGMIEYVCDQGVPAYPENAQFFGYYMGDHILLNPGFYSAVAFRDWCWFKLGNPGLLESYSGYQDWNPLPDTLDILDTGNCEIFGLGLRPHDYSALEDEDRVSALNDLITERDLAYASGANSIRTIRNGITNVIRWYCYDERIWTEWSQLSQTGAERFPIEGRVREQYNYAGADAAIQISLGYNDPISNRPTLSYTEQDKLQVRSAGASSGRHISWTAAAKPFGYLGTSNEPTRPDVNMLVLPAFHDIRLIPVDASSAPSGGAFNPGWHEHIYMHLPNYLSSGAAGLVAGCEYCDSLARFELPLFRSEGVTWLNERNSSNELVHPCNYSHGGGNNYGGTRRGH